MARTKAQNEAQARYNRANVKSVSVSFYPKDAELYKFVATHENRAGFIKDLIRAEMILQIEAGTYHPGTDGE